ncbi:MAG TPA: metalloregulator ArsR/SmtB family transcription factor [Bryobacteraceae bacterium]|nr:metalloregulator ArsR/SmtB family transcription factor [Bryobacteraceae bacterium]
MAELLRALKLLGDEGRLRILRLLQTEELSVAELQEILGMGQSRISMQLSPLKQAGLIEVRRAGQKSLYRVSDSKDGNAILGELLRQAGQEIAEAEQDDRALRLILEKRKDKLRTYFDELAGRFGRHYVPGRSWKGLSEMFLKLMPPFVVADLGAGEGTLSLLLAQRAERVIAVDHSQKMLEYVVEIAKRNGVRNLEYRLGDLEELPLQDAEVDLTLLHQSLHHALHPAKAVAEAYRILKPGGRVVVMDLVKHRFEEAREMYADVWLGFSQVELVDMLQAAGFVSVDASVVHREEELPHFETLLAVGSKPLLLEQKIPDKHRVNS